MLYNTADNFQKEQFQTRAAKLAKSGAVVELTEKRPRRTIPQNAYLHVILSYFASQAGETAEYVKEKYYKYLVNRDLYLRKKQDLYLGIVSYLRSSTELDTEEMALSITRFRNWASETAGIYIPSAEEGTLVRLMEIEIERYKEYL